ncbi:unnamed protein product [Camellia sinensis]
MGGVGVHQDTVNTHSHGRGEPKQYLLQQKPDRQTDIEREVYDLATKPQNQILHTPKPKQKPCGEDSLHSSTTLPPSLKSLLPRSRFSSHPPYPFLAPSLPIMVQSVARSFNHHEMQYSTTMPNDPDIHEDFKDVKDNPVMLYMKGVPDLPRCRFSSLAVRVLKEYN